MLASLPTSMVPTAAVTPSSAAGVTVTARKASSGLMPAAIVARTRSRKVAPLSPPNDANATGLLERSFGIEDKRMAIEKKYKAEMLKVLPGKVVARFFQVDRRVNNLIDLKLSSQIPLVE